MEPYPYIDRKVIEIAAIAEELLEKRLEGITTDELKPAVEKAYKLKEKPYSGSQGFEFRNAIRDIEVAIEKIGTISMAITHLSLVRTNPNRSSNSLDEEIKIIIMEAALS